jgi:hypothetical protein
VCPVGGPAGLAIGTAEWLAGAGRDDRWRHAKVCVAPGMILQARPDGAEIVRQEPRPGDLWSTGLYPLSDKQRAMAWDIGQKLEGTPYSWADYAAIGLHRLHVPAPGLREFIKSTASMICSYLADFFQLILGVHLFDDGRWPGYVMPSDLGLLLEMANRDWNRL